MSGGISIRTRVRQAWTAVRRTFTPSDVAWKAAGWAVFGIWVLLLAAFLVLQLLPHFTIWGGIGLAAFFGAMAGISLAGYLLFWLIGSLSRGYRWALLLALMPLLFLVVAFGWGAKGAVIILVLVLGVSLTAGAGAALARRSGRRIAAGIALAVGVVLLGGLTVAFFRPQGEANPILAGYHLTGETLALTDPGKPGPYAVETFTYGSGKDLHRPEYGAKATYKTPTVDGSKLDAEWTGIQGKLRSAFWGFGPQDMPLQGRVWAPKGPGPFPLVLIIHGNHQAEDYSDLGYAYLGELLASQGFILVSVDENFINSSQSDQINPIKRRKGDENDARAWLLLEHLVQWRRWMADPAHPLHGKADMDRIGLIGHSRGGEAVATAAAFNRLRAYPDDATLAFDYGFNIRGVAAIAPADGQYKPRGRPTPLVDTNYFVIHGGLDGDVTSFMGLAQYARDGITAGSQAFKSSLYVADANHGQFHTDWGRNDFGGIGLLIIDERPIMDPEDQRRIAKVYLSGFLRAALRDEAGYRDLLKDPRRGAAWLPDTFMSADYADGGTRWLARFEDDLDPRTGETPEITIAGRNLSVWREEQLKLKSKELGSFGTTLAWDDRVHRAPASYAIGFTTPPAVTPATELVFGLSQSKASTLPAGFNPPKTKTKEKPAPLDWTLVLTDAAGREAKLPLSRDQALYPQVKGPTRRISMLETDPTSELVLRGYRLPLAAFAAANPALDLSRLTGVRFDFDRSKRGAIVLDDVGLAEPVSAGVTR